MHGCMPAGDTAPLIFVDDVAAASGPTGGARVHVCVRSVQRGGQPLTFDVTVPLDHPAADVQAALLETQMRLVGIFDDLVETLTTEPLGLREPPGPRSNASSHRASPDVSDEQRPC